MQFYRRILPPTKSKIEHITIIVRQPRIEICPWNVIEGVKEEDDWHFINLIIVLFFRHTELRWRQLSDVPVRGYQSYTTTSDDIY